MRVRLPLPLSDRQVALLLGAAVLAVAVAAVSPYPVGVFVDDGYYVILAKALATGHGLRNLQLPGEPYGLHYPPGYPFFLSLLWRLAPGFPGNVAVFKLANAGLLGVVAGLTYLFGVKRLGLSGRFAAPAALLGAASIPALLLAGMVLSETLFLALLLVALLAAERALGSPTLQRAAVAGVLCGTLALVRSIGVVVLPVAALLLWRRGGWRCAVVALGAGSVVLLPWQAFAAAHPGGGLAALAWPVEGYGSWLVRGYREMGWSGLWTVPVKNATVLFDSLRVLLAPLLPVAVKDVFLAAAAVVWVSGAVAAARRAPIFLGASLGYAAVALMWPAAPVRFLWAVWPLVVLLFALGVSAIAGWRAPGRAGVWARRAALTACAVVATGHLAYNVRGYRGAWWDSIPRAEAAWAAPLVRWAAERTRPGDVLVSDYDNMQYLYAGRQALPPYGATAAEYVRPVSERARAETLGSVLRLSGARYLITATDSVVRAAGLLEGRRDMRLVLVDTLGHGGVVFRVERPAAAAPAPGLVEP